MSIPLVLLTQTIFCSSFCSWIGPIGQFWHVLTTSQMWHVPRTFLLDSMIWGWNLDRRVLLPHIIIHLGSDLKQKAWMVSLRNNQLCQSRGYHKNQDLPCSYFWAGRLKCGSHLCCYGLHIDLYPFCIVWGSTWNILARWNPRITWESKSSCQIFGGFLKWGYPNSWMVFFMGQSHLEMDDLGVPLWLRNPHTVEWSICLFLATNWMR